MNIKSKFTWPKGTTFKFVGDTPTPVDEKGNTCIPSGVYVAWYEDNSHIAGFSVGLTKLNYGVADTLAAMGEALRAFAAAPKVAIEPPKDKSRGGQREATAVLGELGFGATEPKVRKPRKGAKAVKTAEATEEAPEPLKARLSKFDLLVGRGVPLARAQAACSLTDAELAHVE